MKEIKFINANCHLPVKNLKETLTYYRDKLGFYEEWVWKVKDGGIQRNELRLLFAENPEYTAVINTNKHRLPVLWFVDNIEDIFAEYKNKGIVIADPLHEHSYQMKEFAFIDINGYYIRVCESIEVS
jgi:catechol 2,3-dioxygenase-like lactoylglutathione lyase family enzyme